MFIRIILSERYKKQEIRGYSQFNMITESEAKPNVTSHVSSVHLQIKTIRRDLES